MTESFENFVKNLGLTYAHLSVLATSRPRGGVSVYVRYRDDELASMDFPSEACAIRAISAFLLAATDAAIVKIQARL